MIEKITVLGKEYEIEVKQEPKLDLYGHKDGLWWVSSCNSFKIKLTGKGHKEKHQTIANLHGTIYQYLQIIGQVK